MHAIDVSPSAREIAVISPDVRWINIDLRALWRYRELLAVLVGRELRIRYKQAAIGIGWAVIQPLLAALIFTAVFGHFAHLPSEGLPYALFTFTALLPWTYFSEALRRAATGLVDDSELIRKIYFPRLIIPIAMVITPLVDLLFSFAVLAGLMVWYGVTPGWQLVFLPLLVLESALLALAIGLWLGPVNVRFRDVKHVLPFLIQIWMYASPVVYGLGVVPERWRGWYSVNPMVGVIEGFRWCLLGTAQPDLAAIGIGVTGVLAALFGGLLYFRRMERFFADVI